MNQEFKETKIIKTSMDGPFEDHIWKYVLNLPEWLSKWDVYDYWEKERIFSLEKELKKGDILFDVGVESGWLSVLYAKYIVGGENMVLFEPSLQYWPLIKSIWEGNDLELPMGCFQGFVGREDKKVVGEEFEGKWPIAVNGELISSGMPYAYIHNQEDMKKISMVSLDSWSKKNKIFPDAVTIDVEGAEMDVIRGMMNILMEKKPLVWISIHPDLMLRDYHVSKKGLLLWMKKIGYEGELLAIDHEEHWIFKPKQS